MTAPFFPGMPDVGERIRQAAHVVVALDYDGTLTPIVEEPTLAALPAPMRNVLRALVRRDGVTVAVVSGRARADLQGLIGIPGVIYAGNHGLEINGPGLNFIEPGAGAAADELHILGQEIAKKLHPIEGTFVEDKGLTLSIHHRRAAPVNGEDIMRIVQDVVAPRRDRFHVTLGDKVYEVRPLLRWNKGSAVEWIKAQIGKPETVVIYIGDDTTDEDAFRALGEEAITIRVGDHTQTAARFLLPEPASVQHFLEWVNELRE